MLCLFLLGLLITWMGLLEKRPINLPSSSPTDGAVTLTRASTSLRFSSALEMKNCFPTHRPTKVVPFEGSVASNGFPDAPAHSTELSGGVGSPEIETTTRGGAKCWFFSVPADLGPPRVTYHHRSGGWTKKPKIRPVGVGQIHQ